MEALQRGRRAAAPARLVELQLVGFLHKKMERGHQWVRRDMGKREGGTEGAEVVEVHRKTRGMAAENTYSGEQFCEPGGTNCRG